MRCNSATPAPSQWFSSALICVICGQMVLLLLLFAVACGLLPIALIDHRCGEIAHNGRKFIFQSAPFRLKEYSDKKGMAVEFAATNFAFDVASVHTQQTGEESRLMVRVRALA